MKAPEGSYLIAGRPRSRTAWLAAVLYGQTPCYHDDLHRLEEYVARGRAFGFAAPSLVVTRPDLALEVFGECPIVVVERPASESWPALERWVGFPLGSWVDLELRFQWFLDHVPRQRLLTVPYEALEAFEGVAAVNLHCLKTPLCHDRYRVFDGLRIEQHREKAARNTPPDVVTGSLAWRG